MWYFRCSLRNLQKSMNFRSISKKKLQKCYNFSSKNWFLCVEKICFEFEIGYILIDLNWIFQMKPSEFRIFHFSSKLWWKNYWKLLKLLRCQKTHCVQTSQIEDLNKDCVKTLRPYFLQFLRNKLSKRVKFGPDRAGSVRRFKLFRFKWFKINHSDKWFMS